MFRCLVHGARTRVTNWVNGFGVIFCCCVCGMYACMCLSVFCSESLVGCLGVHGGFVCVIL